MNQNTEQENFYELLRLAYVAGSEAAEYIVDRTELRDHLSLSELKRGDGILIIKKDGVIHNLFKRYSTNNRIDSARIYERDDDIVLEIEYNFHTRRKRDISINALKAIKHVLSSLEEIKLSTLKS